MFLYNTQIEVLKDNVNFFLIMLNLCTINLRLRFFCLHRELFYLQTQLCFLINFSEKSIIQGLIIGYLH